VTGSGSLSITSAIVDPALLDLPWSLPLDAWPDDSIATLPKGISRHLVRFAHLGGYVVAIKETSADLARREYEMLRTLQRLDVPCVAAGAGHTKSPQLAGAGGDTGLVTPQQLF
jgi:hypothetical protein